AHFSLGIVAGERFAIELTPSTFPQRHFARDRFPQRHVAGERVGMLLGKASNVVVPLVKSASYLLEEKNGVAPSVKEKNGVSMESDDTMNEDTPVGVASAILEGVTSSVVDMAVETEKLSSLNDTTVMGSFPPLSTLGATTAGNAPGKSSYANITGKPSGKKVNVRTLFTPGGNGIDVVVSVDSICAISE
ncbi:hypothetical protein Tco_1486865, partial [Tanacetum coccineum]